MLSKIFKFYCCYYIMYYNSLVELKDVIVQKILNLSIQIARLIIRLTIGTLIKLKMSYFTFDIYQIKIW